MDQKGYKRKHLRAPLKSFFLYEDDGFVYKARVLNVSEEGVLIECLPHLPRINIIPVILDIPHILPLERLDMTELREFDFRNLEREIHRARVKTIRRTGETSDIEQIFIKNIGGQIQAVSPALRSCISKYVSGYASNVVFLLTLLENQDGGKERIERIRLLAGIMGYDENLKISILRQVVLHDYKSLKFL